MSARLTLRPETVAYVWDNCGGWAARERWASVPASTLNTLAGEGRRRAGRGPIRGDLQHLGEGNELILDRGWDGAPVIGSAAAAAALGLPLSTMLP